MCKNFDLTGSFGPWLVSADELPKGAHGLKVQTRLNGQLLQDGNTADFLFNVAQVLVIMSEVMTLEPGDVIITGTPAGVGPLIARGNVVVGVEGLGQLTNKVSAKP